MPEKKEKPVIHKPHTADPEILTNEIIDVVNDEQENKTHAIITNIIFFIINGSF